MSEGRFSTIRFNEWICITAQYEKTVARIGRQVYQGYSRGLIVDFTALEMCKQISDTFAEARSMREDLEEELERDALDGLNVEETKIADEHRSLTQAQKTKRTFKLKIAKFMGRAAINRKLAAHRDQVRDHSRDLGLRALACYKDNPLLKVKGHKSLCRLADQLSEDADVKWQEIVKTNKESGGGLSFHTILINFIGSFANFGKNTPLGRAVLKYFKYDEAAENKKLKEAYQGSATAEVLRAQLEEIEEPHLDVGREMDNMQQEYEETPVEWNLPSSGNEPESYPAYTPAPEQATEKWEPVADTWDPGTAADDDFLDAVAEVPSFEPATEPAPPAPSGGPTLLRRRPEPEAESWNEPPSLPSISREQGPPTVAAGKQEAAGEEWDWSNSDSGDAWEVPEPPTNPAPSLQKADPFVAEGNAEVDPFDFGEPEQNPFAAESRPTIPQRPSAPTIPNIGSAPSQPGPPARAPQSRPAPAAQSRPSTPAPPARPPAAPSQDSWAAPAPSPAPAAGSNWGQEPTAASRPPFVKSQQKEQPLGDWSSDPTPPSSHSNWGNDPTPPTSHSNWGTDEPDYGWSTPQASKPAAPQPPAAPEPPAAPQPPAPKAPEAPPFAQPPQAPPPAPTPAASLADDDSDPLLKLLRSDDKPAAPPPGEDLLDDDLLPDFLKNRDDEESSADDAFIPELPSFLSSEDGPQLEIVPFGSKEDLQPVKPGDDSDEEPFIPQMPDL